MGYPPGAADDYVRCPDLHDPNAFAVRVIGDSMEPKYHHGYIIIYWDGGAKAFPEQSFSTPVEFQIVVDLLRNEKPVWWDEPTQRLYANQEPVGEGE